jgi:putative ABC transport system ATP-binding protein
MIELSGVRKAFHQGRDNEFWALNGIDLRVEPRRVTVLRGPSGSGKTTLLTIIGGLARPSAGRVRLRDRELTSLPERFLTDVRRRTFGFVFQQHNLITGMTALENIMLPAYPLGLAYGGLRDRAEGLLERLALVHRRAARVEWLSGGEQQRVAIARALINDPEVIIADEPTANLDTTLSRNFLQILETLKAQGKTVLLTSHDPLVVESAVVDRVVAMRDGRIVEEGGRP